MVRSHPQLGLWGHIQVPYMKTEPPAGKGHAEKIPAGFFQGTPEGLISQSLKDDFSLLLLLSHGLLYKHYHVSEHRQPSVCCI